MAKLATEPSAQLYNYMCQTIGTTIRKSINSCQLKLTRAISAPAQLRLPPSPPARQPTQLNYTPTTVIRAPHSFWYCWPVITKQFPFASFLSTAHSSGAILRTATAFKPIKSRVCHSPPPLTLLSPFSCLPAALVLPPAALIRSGRFNAAQSVRENAESRKWKSSLLPPRVPIHSIMCHNIKMPTPGKGEFRLLCVCYLLISRDEISNSNIYWLSICIQPPLRPIRLPIEPRHNTATQ